MAALLDRGSILKELNLTPSEKVANVYARFVQKIIDQTILPRKILIQHAETGIEIVVEKGKIARYSEHDLKRDVWIKHPPSASQGLVNGALDIHADRALKEGEILISMLNSNEISELKELEKAEKKAAKPTPVEAKPLVNKKKARNSGAALASDQGSPLIIEEFTASLKGKVRYLYCENTITGEIAEFGGSDVLTAEMVKSIWPELSTWREKISKAVSNGPKLIVTLAHSNSGFMQFIAVDKNYYLFAEVDANKFGVVLGLWNIATKPGK